MSNWVYKRTTKTIKSDITAESNDDVVCDRVLHVSTCWRCLQACKECTKRDCPCSVIIELLAQSLLDRYLSNITRRLSTKAGCSYAAEFSEKRMEDMLCRDCITRHPPEHFFAREDSIIHHR